MQARALMQGAVGWAVASAASLLLVFLVRRGAIDVPARWETVFYVLAIADPALMFAMWGIRERRANARDALERIEPRPDEPVVLTRDARAFLRRRGNTVWLWRDGARVKVATDQPRSGARFDYAPLANGVEAYLDPALARDPIPITVTMNEPLSRLRASRPRTSDRVVAKPVARRVIRRRGGRVWCGEVRAA